MTYHLRERRPKIEKRAHSNVKISRRTALMILAAVGTHREIAERFGVSSATVHRVKSGKWFATDRAPTPCEDFTPPTRCPR